MGQLIPWKLITAHLKNETTVEEENLLQRWLAEENNLELYTEIELLWNEVQSEVSVYNPDVDHYWEIMQKRINKGKETKKKISIREKLLAIAAAASILLTIGTTYLFLDKGSDEIHSYSAISGKSKITLPDNSTIWVNSGSTISYPGAFPDNRQIDLTGEAAFDVVKDDKHPFVVSVSGIKVKVYGTYFNVSSYDDEENITVALKEGSVSILMEDSESFLKPGEMATINKKDMSLSISKANMNLEFFWANESVYFKAKPLGYICEYLEKWYNVKIEVDPEIAKSQFYTFTIKDDSLEQILRIMSKINPITYSFDDKNNVKIMRVKP
jgi:ferric-dicitrate binding protein FerR (iron transport regulator)